MKKYISIKQVEAEPMIMGEAADIGILRAPDYYDLDVNRPGYHVKYGDGQEIWLRAETFKERYCQINDERQNMTFGDAIEVLKQGGAIRRKGWNWIIRQLGTNI